MNDHADLENWPVYPDGIEGVLLFRGPVEPGEDADCAHCGRPIPRGENCIGTDEGLLHPACFDSSPTPLQRRMRSDADGRADAARHRLRIRRCRVLADDPGIPRPMTTPLTRENLLSDAADAAATDRIAWAMLVASGEQSPRKVWAENADEWRSYAEGVWRSAFDAACVALNQEEKSA